MAYGLSKRSGLEVPPNPRVQIIPLADITLVLLVVFLVTTSAALELVKVELPKAVNTVARDVNLAVQVSISKEKPPTTSGKTPASAAKAIIPAKPASAEGDKAKDGKKDPWMFYFEDVSTGIELKNLWPTLCEVKGRSDWAMAMIRADKSTPCEHVAVLIQCLEGLGVGEIAFRMQEEGQEQEEKRGFKR